MLTCKQCGERVIAKESGAFVRPCGHDQAGVVAALAATVIGKGGMVKR